MKYNAEKTYDDGCDGDNDISGFRFYDLIKQHRDLDVALMQCIGLKDKNGKLIYEGDIIECKFKHYNQDIHGYYEVRYTKYYYELLLINLITPDNITSNIHLRLGSDDISSEGNQLVILANNNRWNLSHSFYIPVEVIGNIYENSTLIIYF